MKKSNGIFFAIVILVLAQRNFLDRVVKPIADFFVWLFILNLSQSPVSIAGEIFVKFATFTLSYAAVGAIFNATGWFNSRSMKIAYYVISTIISFALCYIVMLFETYMIQIAIAVLVVSIMAFIIYIVIQKRQKTKYKIPPPPAAET